MVKAFKISAVLQHLFHQSLFPLEWSEELELCLSCFGKQKQETGPLTSKSDHVPLKISGEEGKGEARCS